MKASASLAILALLGQGSALRPRRLDVTTLQFEDEVEHLPRDRFTFENTINSFIEKLGHQGTTQESDYIPETEGGQKDYERFGGLDTTTMLK